MPYGETKVYYDGSHYIAIPHTERPYRRRPKKAEEEITVTQDENGEKIIPAEEKAESPPDENTVENVTDDTQEITETPNENKPPSKPVKTVTTTKKQLFDRFCRQPETPENGKETLYNGRYATILQGRRSNG